MLLETKDEIRKIFRQKRAEISDKQRKLKNREIAKNLYANVSIKPKSVIAGYIAMPSEVDVSLLIEMYEEDGHIICLPCIERENEPLVFRKYKRGAPLLLNKKFGTKEPPDNFEEVQPNLIITPLVAFDAAGTRLGMGKGFYDRTFESMAGIHDFIAVGASYACQQTPYLRPHPHDFKLDAVVTEKKVFVF